MGDSEKPIGVIAYLKNIYNFIKERNGRNRPQDLINLKHNMDRGLVKQASDEVEFSGENKPTRKFTTEITRDKIKPENIVTATGIGDDVHSL